MLLTAAKVLTETGVRSGVGIACDRLGRIKALGDLTTMGRPDLDLGQRLLLPGMVNAHAVSVSRCWRGRANTAEPWRGAATRLPRIGPDELFVITRHAFIEMLRAGVTAVGEFHLWHYQDDGTPFDDKAATAEAVAQAALAAGIRLCWLRVICLDDDAGALPKNLCDRTLDAAWEHTETAVARLQQLGDARLSWGIGIYDQDHVPQDAVVSAKTNAGHLPLFVRLGTERTRVVDWVKRYGVSPVVALERTGVLDATTTVIPGAPLCSGDAQALAQGGASLCLCPAYAGGEFNRYAPLSELVRERVNTCLGASGPAPFALDTVAAQLLSLEPPSHGACVFDPLARRHLHHAAWCAATANAARALDLSLGVLRPGAWADLIALDLLHPSLAGQDDDALVPTWLAGASSAALCEVVVGGELVIVNGEHRLGHASAQALAGVVRRSG